MYSIPLCYEYRAWNDLCLEGFNELTHKTVWIQHVFRRYLLTLLISSTEQFMLSISLLVNFGSFYLLQNIFFSFKISKWGPPWQSCGQESTCQCREHGFDPWSWWISHAMKLLGPCTTTTKPELLSLRAIMTEPTATTYPPPLLTATRESLHSNEDPAQPSIFLKNQFFFKKKDSPKYCQS